jgi:predicted alpha/beta hydrolase family esterase
VRRAGKGTREKGADPKARRIYLPGATIPNQAELEDWLDQVRAEVEEALAAKPVIL